MPMLRGLYMVMQEAGDNLPHILGFDTPRTASDDTLLEIWNDDANTGRKAVIDLDGKYYSAAYAVGSIPYMVAGGVTGVQRMDALAIGSAYSVLQVNSGGTAPEWSSVLRLEATSASAAAWGAEITHNRTGGDGNTVRGVEAEILSNHTGSQTGVVSGLRSRLNMAGSGGSTTTAYGIQVDLDVGTGHTVNSLVGISIDSFVSSGTVNGAMGISIGTVTVGGTTNYGIQVGNVSGASANYAIYTGLGDVRFGDDLDVEGHAAIGDNAAVGTGTILTLSESVAGSAVARQGVISTTTVTGTGGSGDLRGLQFTVTGAHTSGTQTDIVGVYGYASLTGSGGTTTNVRHFEAATNVGSGHTIGTLHAIHVGAPLGVGTITNAYGVYVESMIAGATTNYGLYLGNVSGGSGSNYAIYTGDGLVRFGDGLLLPASTASTPSLNVPHGTEPTSKTNGDIWTESDGVHVYINGTEYTLDMTAV